MRKKLQKLENQRLTFRGSFTKYGIKRGYKYPLTTVLLTRIHCVSIAIENITDHVWLNYTKGIRELRLDYGDIIEFEATVREYEAGYKGSRFDDEQISDEYVAPIRTDYGLKFPRNIRKVLENGQVKKDITLPVLLQPIDPPFEETRIQRIEIWKAEQQDHFSVSHPSKVGSVGVPNLQETGKKYKSLDNFLI